MKVQSIIDDGGYDTFAGVAHLPGTGDVHIVRRVLRVEEMPLVSKAGIADGESVDDVVIVRIVFGFGLIDGRRRSTFEVQPSFGALFGDLKLETAYGTRSQ